MPRYIVAAPSYSPENGGAIFLHELAHQLVALGQQAALWPMNHMPNGLLRRQIPAVWRRPSLLWRAPGFAQAEGRDIPVVSRHDIRRDDIVVYPEVVLGNPLAARHVIRWLLYRPGLRRPYDFGPGEMFFRAGEMSDLPELTGGAPDLFLWKINPVYRNENRPDRKGVCYLLRKGEHKPRIPETADAICIDELPHAETAEIFNRCDTFYSYDEASFYSQYAAICGCDSVVIPGLYPSREAWTAEHPLGRHGVAYGLDDLPHARATRPLVAGMLQAQEAAGLATVARFIALSRERFGFPPTG